MRDPLDGGPAVEQRWAEYQASHSAAYLLVWLLSELDEFAPRYVEDLNTRLAHGIIQADNERDEAGGDLPLDEPSVGIQDAGGSGVTFLSYDEAVELEARLFPFSDSAADMAIGARGNAVVALHSALEAYLVGVGVDLRRQPLPTALARHFANQKTFAVAPSDQDRFWEFDQTRHLFVHHRGVVTERYVRAVPDCKLIVGEMRRVSAGDLHRYADLSWRLASRVRQAMGDSRTADGSANGLGNHVD